MKIKKIILSVFLMNFNYINIFSFCCCFKKNNNKNDLINNKNENNSENNYENLKKVKEIKNNDNENKDNENNDKKEDIDKLEKLLPDKLIYKNSFYKWSGDYCGIQCCNYFLATLFYNEDEILKEFENSNIKFLNNIAQIVNDFKNNNFNNNCHELLFNSICDLFFEIAESLTLTDFEDEENNKNINYKIFEDCLYIIIALCDFKTNKNLNTHELKKNNITLSQYISNFEIFKNEENFLYEFKKIIKSIKNSKISNHSVSPNVVEHIMQIISLLKKEINYTRLKNGNYDIKIKEKNYNLFYNLNKKYKNLLYCCFTVNLGSIGHGCCFYYNFKDKKYYFVSNEKEIEVHLDYILNDKLDIETKINNLYKKLNDQNIITYDYKYRCNDCFIYENN